MIGPAGNVQVSCVRAQTPFQPSKSEPSSGFAVTVIALPKPKLAVQTVPQSSFEAVTRPLPLPVLRSLKLDVDRRREPEIRVAVKPRARPGRLIFDGDRAGPRGQRLAQVVRVGLRVPAREDRRSVRQRRASRACAAQTRGRSPRLRLRVEHRADPPALKDTVAPPGSENFTASISGEKTATTEVRSSSSLTCSVARAAVGLAPTARSYLPAPTVVDRRVSLTDVPRSYVHCSRLRRRALCTESGRPRRSAPRRRCRVRARRPAG